MKTETRCARCDRVFLAEEIDRRFGGLCPECLGAMAMQESSVPTETTGDPPPIQPGARFRDLDVLEVLGQGGMGTVYKARQSDLDRLIALKILSPKLASDPEFAERFHREAKALASLNHPNIVHVHEFGKEGKLLFLTMEYVDGTNLRSVMRDHKLSAKEALAIVPQICDALEYAHSQGIVHRDIKPENILLDRQGCVKIADFGLAKIAVADATRVTKTNVVMGTPHYMAPEQVESLQSVDHRADIYSLGVVFYEMLTGELPIGRFAPPSKKIQIDVRLDEVVLKALEKDRELRYQRAAEVKTGIETAASAPPAATGQPGARASWLRIVPMVLVVLVVSFFTRPKMPASAVLGVGCLMYFAALLLWGKVRFKPWIFLVAASIVSLGLVAYGCTLLITYRLFVAGMGVFLLAHTAWMAFRLRSRARWLAAPSALVAAALLAFMSLDEVRVQEFESQWHQVAVGKDRTDIRRDVGKPDREYSPGTFGFLTRAPEEVWVYEGRNRILKGSSNPPYVELAIDRLFGPAERDHVLFFDASGKLVKIE